MDNDGEDDLKSANNLPPLISVVVPVFNNEAYVERALESVFEQGYENLEIIAIDDGSTDRTAEILAKFSQCIKVIRQSNAGSAVARNVGLREATGVFVAFLDADDWFLPEKFHRQAEILQANPRLGAVHSGWKIADSEGTTIKDVQPWTFAPRLDLHTWLTRKPIKLGAMLFRRDWLSKVNGFDPELRQSQDVDLMLRLSLAGCLFGWLKDFTLCYRHHQASTIRSNSLDQVKYGTMVLDKFYANPKVPLTIKRRERSVRYYSSLWLAWHLFHTGNADAVGHQLAQPRKYSRFEFRRTAHDWLYHFAKWTTTAGADVERVREMIPTFMSLGDIETPDRGELAAELNWWLTVWWPYIQQHETEARHNLTSTSTQNPQLLLRRIAYYLRTSAVPVRVEAFDRFWYDAFAVGVFQSSDQHQAIGLYLSLCGRALHSGDIRTFLKALLRVLQYGRRPATWLSAFRSVRSRWYLAFLC